MMRSLQAPPKATLSIYRLRLSPEDEQKLMQAQLNSKVGEQ